MVSLGSSNLAGRGRHLRDGGIVALAISQHSAGGALDLPSRLVGLITFHHVPFENILADGNTQLVNPHSKIR